MKKYTSPEMEIVVVEATDIVLASKAPELDTDWLS